MVKEKTIINDLQDIPNNKLNKLTVCSSAEKALKDSHAICILTEWDEFKSMNFKNLSSLMKEPILFLDGRNIISHSKLNRTFKKFMSIDK